MGLSYSQGRSSPFSKALQRCVMFGLAHPIPRGLAVRRRIPAVAHRHLRRLPDEVRAAHDDWQRTTIALDDLTRAHRLALAMVDVGDDLGQNSRHWWNSVTRPMSWATRCSGRVCRKKVNGGQTAFPEVKSGNRGLSRILLG